MGAIPDFTRLAARGVRGLDPYVPGKPLEELEREYGIRGAIKLASNENPLGPSPRAVEAIAERVGGRSAVSGRRWFSPASGTGAAAAGGCTEQITLGNGSNDVLVLLAETFLTPAAEAVYSEFAFLVYRLAVQATGATARVAARAAAGWTTASRP